MNIRKIFYSIIFIILLILLSCPHLKKIALVKKNINVPMVNSKDPGKPGTGKVEEKKPVERIGERIVYDVRLMRVSLGRAVFSHLPRAERATTTAILAETLIQRAAGTTRPSHSQQTE